MYVATVPNRSSPPAILLRESYRQNGKVLNRTLANLSDWPAEKVQSLRAVLRGDRMMPAGEGGFEIRRSLPHGHVVAALATARQIGLDRRHRGLHAPLVEHHQVRPVARAHEPVALPALLELADLDRARSDVDADEVLSL